MGDYVIRICLDSTLFPKCQGCPHHRLDPERSFAEDERDRYACYLNEDLTGAERLAYLKRILALYKEKGLQAE